MAHQAGGRARSLASGEGRLDNGQHILIGAYRETLDLMRTVGVDTSAVLRRSPLELRYPDGSGLRLPSGHATLAFVRGVLGVQHWTWPDRLSLLRTAASWRWHRFECQQDQTVSDLCQHLPTPVIHDLMEPLCVAALNTPMNSASGRVFLKVLEDALFAGPGSADLLLPRVPLSTLLPDPAVAWLQARGARLHWGRRVMTVVPDQDRWSVDGEAFEAVVLATTATEAARIAAPIDADWSRMACSLRYEPIVTVWLRDDSAISAGCPMTALHSDSRSPAQFAFDLGTLGGPVGLHAWVVSGAAGWVEQGMAVTAEAVLQQARLAFPGRFQGPNALHHVRAERRATFACTPGLHRPPGLIAPGLAAAGDHVAGHYPATLEGAVISGKAAWRLATGH
jgi:squalene-associated FAD-dependent desaturase